MRYYAIQYKIAILFNQKYSNKQGIKDIGYNDLCLFGYDKTTLSLTFYQ